MSDWNPDFDRLGGLVVVAIGLVIVVKVVYELAQVFS